MIRSRRALVPATDLRGRDLILSGPAERNEELAFIPMSAAQGLPGNSAMSNIQTPGVFMPVLDGFFTDQNSTMVNRLYREIYYSDPVCGSAVDLLSTFPFGDFSLSGLNDERQLRKYAQCVDSLRIRTLLPDLSIDYLVLGKFIATLTWNHTKGYHTAISPHNPDFCLTEPIPTYGSDPLVQLQIPPELLAILKSKKPELQRVINSLPKEIQEAQKNKGSVYLDPDSLVYIKRRAGTGDYAGTSLLRRVLPIWLMEKALIRGTLDQFWKRQRAILHLTIANDMREPTPEDYQGITNLFLGADHDPTGAVIATSASINVNEVRRGDDFLKYGDTYDQFSRMKLQGLGISESFLSGDATYSNAQGAISVMMQYFSAYRAGVSREIFYDRLFPAIAIANKYRRRNSVVLSSGKETFDHEDGFDGIKHSMLSGMTAEFASNMPTRLHEANMAEYAMPRVTWHDSLKPDNTQEFQDMLDRLAQHGVPIPLRMWAASAGLSLEQIVDQEKTDKKLRAHVKPWLKLIAKSAAVAQGTDMGDENAMGGGGRDEAGAEEEASKLLSLLPGATAATGRRVGVLERNFEGAGLDHYEETGGSKRYSLTKGRKRAIDDKMNRSIAEAAAVLTKAERAAVNKRHAETAKRKFYIPTKKA